MRRMGIVSMNVLFGFLTKLTYRELCEFPGCAGPFEGAFASEERIRLFRQRLGLLTPAECCERKMDVYELIDGAVRRDLKAPGPTTPG